MKEDQKYPGEELSLFENATNWKHYFSRFILPLLKGRVLEVGAGIGGTTTILNKNTAAEWVLLEPDKNMQQLLHEKIKNKALPGNCKVSGHSIGSLTPDDQFDSIIYIDVLEHIEKDRDEIQKASAHLKPGGHLIILSPAFPFLFSPFDKSIGHFRRYDKKNLSALAAPGLLKQRLFYLDSAGFFASLANKLFLKQSYPTKRQVQLWDKWMIPVSKITDRIFFYSFGKSILAVWKKNKAHV